MTRNLYGELSRRLKRGFYLDNLANVAILCDEGSWQTEHPVGLFVLSRILWQLDDWWRERPLPTVESERMQAMLEPPIMTYLNAAADSDLDARAELDYLSEIVRSYLRWVHEKGGRS